MSIYICNNLLQNVQIIPISEIFPIEFYHLFSLHNFIEIGLNSALKLVISIYTKEQFAIHFVM